MDNNIIEEINNNTDKKYLDMMGKVIRLKEVVEKTQAINTKLLFSIIILILFDIIIK